MKEPECNEKILLDILSIVKILDSFCAEKISISKQEPEYFARTLSR